LLIIVHFINHWNWNKNMIAQLFGKNLQPLTLVAVIDGLLFIRMVMVLEAGFVISKWFNLDPAN
jgi:hypothetical protein